MLDRERLGRRAVETTGVDGDVAAAAPLGSRLVTVDPAGRVRATADGETIDVDARCPGVSWAMASRRAAVFGCATGALRVAGGDGTPTATTIPYPADAPAQRPATVTHRDRADVFAGIAAGHVWVLDSRQRSWVLIPALTRWR